AVSGSQRAVQRADRVADDRVEPARRRAVGREQPLHVTPQLPIVAALAIEECGARGVVLFERLVEELLRALPALGVHWPLSAPRCTLSDASVARRSRGALATDSERRRAVSSSVQPPK